MRKLISTVCCLYITQIAIIFWPGSTIKNLTANGDGTDGNSLMRIEQSRVKYAFDFVPLVGLFTAISSCRWRCSVRVKSITISFEQDYEFVSRNDNLSARLKEDFIEVWNFEKKLFAVRHSDVVVF